jgi:uncharacterized delta-60 repeat protein
MRRKSFSPVVLLVALTASLFGAQPVAGSPVPGVLDAAFGSGGVATLPEAGESLPAVVETVDGKLVLVGSGLSASNDSQDFVIRRLLPNGTPDLAFSGGRRTIDFAEPTPPPGPGQLPILSTPTNDVATSAAAGPDGTLLVGGYTSRGAKLAFALYKTGPGPVFGHDGRVVTPIGDGNGVVRSVFLLPDGKVLAVGDPVGEPGGVILARYEVDGALDTTFGAGGILRTDRLSSASAAMLSSESRIVIAGTIANGQGAILRLLPDGQPDPSFGTAGLAVGVIGGVNRLTLGPVGEIYLGGSRLARMAPDGTLDPTFGTATLYTAPAFISGLALQPDGNLLLTAILSPSQQDTVAVVSRVRPDGALDPTFGSGGSLVVADEFGRAERVLGAMLDRRGGLVAALSFGPVLHPAVRAGVVRVGATGTPVPPLPARSGYWMVDAGGSVYEFGAAGQYGDLSRLGSQASAGASDLEPLPSSFGYWILTPTGVISAHGDASKFGDARGLLHGGERAVSLSATPTGAGYWIFTDRGRVLPFGDARFLGDLADTRLNGPVLDSIATPSGNGYYMVASDGGVFSFGDAAFAGSMGAHRLNAPVESLVPDGDGAGYWLVATDGGVFAFDAPFRGSLGDVKLNRPVTGMVRYGGGYLMVGEDGGIFNFSDKPFLGSLGGSPPEKRVVAVASFG